MKTILLLGISFLLIPFLSQAQNSNIDSKQYTAIRSINPYDTAFEDLEPLKKMIGNARFVLLGERDHDDGNIIEAKTRVLKFLHQEMGYDMIAFESGFYDLNQANEAIKKGENVKLALAKSLFPIWTSQKSFQPFLEYIEANKDLPVLGFDSQFTGEFLYENLADAIQSIVKKEVSQADFEEWIDVVEFMGSEYTFPKNNDFETFQKQHLQIVKVLKKQIKSKSKEDIEFHLHVLRNIIYSAKGYYFGNTGNKSSEEWKAKDSNIRDSLMASNLIFLANKYPTKKFICWAANAHFANRINNLEEEELQEFNPMGKHIKKEFGDENVYILGFTGNDSLQSKETRTIEKEFINTGLDYGLLNLKSLPKGSKFTSSSLSVQGEASLYGEWAKVFDALFFVGEIENRTPTSLDFTSLRKVKQTQNSVKITSKNTISQQDETIKNTSIYKIIKAKKEDLLIHSGQILEKNGKQGIPYVNIGIRGTFIGTASDLNGNFVLKIPKEYKNDTVRVSCIGFQEKAIAIQDLATQKEIILTPFVQELQEVEVLGEPLTGKGIMKEVIKRIEQNYIQEPYTQKRFITNREFNPKDGKFYMHDMLTEWYDDSGYQKESLFMAGYTGFSKLKHIRIAEIDTLTGKVGEYSYNSKTVWAMIGISDKVNHRNNNFLNTKLLKKYEFELTDIIESNTGDKFLISFRFSAKNLTMRNTGELAPVNYSGTILINEADYAVLKISSIAIQDKDRIWKSKDNPAYKTELVWFDKEDITYKKTGDFYFLDKIHQNSNWNTPNGGFVEVYGLDIEIGKREKLTKEEQKRQDKRWGGLPKKGVYNPDDWIGL
jgi:erythromycin esterase-like protein